MGNSQTKESRTPPRRRSQQWSPGPSEAPGRSLYQSSRSGRSRPDLSLLGIGSSHHDRDRDVASLEQRRETKQEREARRLEKERAARVKERERSMKEEHVDGGYLVTQGVYVGTEDFSKAVVRQLMIERRLAPFWRGLNDFSESWAEHQLMAAARGMPIPEPDEIPPELEYTPPKATEVKESAGAANIQHLTVPITSRSQSLNSDVSQSSNPPQSLPSAASPIASGTSTSPLFRTRAKTLAALTSSSKYSSQAEVTPRELQLPNDPYVNGQPIEVYLYKDACECPICFLYYPPYLNRTRCCDQPICSECFVQIKRPDPHVPEHGESDPNANGTAEGEGTERTDTGESQLVSEPSACPFCVQPEFGVTYASPPFRRGLTYATDLSGRPSPNVTSPVSSSSSLSSANIPSIAGRRRATSLSASDPAVVTTDKVRPDWAQKLANARAHAARRSAAATALHTAAYLMNSSSGENSRLGLGRRGLRRATQSDAGRSGSPALNALGDIAPPRDSSRRTRIDDLEDMMMMEAIRLSLASEEDRQRREEKEARKDAKKREKEAKKADKAARKTGLYSSNTSSTALASPPELSSAKAASATPPIVEEASALGKGKGVDRESRSRPPASVENVSSADSILMAADPSTLAEPSRPSQLRHVSSASSSFSSNTGNTPDDHVSNPTAEEGKTSTEPMFNFRSLAAVIDDEDKAHEPEHVENTAQPNVEGSSSGTPSINQPAADTGKPEPAPVVRAAATVDGVLPKELETRSVEITTPAADSETT
ncbi:Protein sip5 [Penicillium chermesinum]|uniref:Protein SIP5 n=1 Tax=Penicillium chermesinum TaxID=63820 RepID=A0A9W9PKI5_9EURO|nr:Protein sip5 [Penicillium chermesinum]KAJ5246987.1 Protein sip5 [Penicillium chermesinum]